MARHLRAGLASLARTRPRACLRHGEGCDSLRCSAGIPERSAGTRGPRRMGRRSRPDPGGRSLGRGDGGAAEAGLSRPERALMAFLGSALPLRRHRPRGDAEPRLEGRRRASQHRRWRHRVLLSRHLPVRPGNRARGLAGRLRRDGDRRCVGVTVYDKATPRLSGTRGYLKLTSGSSSPAIGAIHFSY